MSRVRAIPLSAAVMLAASLALLEGAYADPASSPRSAWTRTPLRSDVSLKDPLMRRGKEVFDARCRACHGAYRQVGAPGSNVFAMPPMPGTYALQLKYKGQKPALLEERTDLTPELVTLFVRRGTGFMPSFRPTEVSDDDLKALGAYLARKRR